MCVSEGTRRWQGSEVARGVRAKERSVGFTLTHPPFGVAKCTMRCVIGLRPKDKSWRRWVFGSNFLGRKHFNEASSGEEDLLIADEWHIP